MPLTEVQSIYYGLQLIGLHMPEELKSDKLFVMGSCCVPIDEWTDSMWMEGARIVSVHSDIFIAAGQPDPLSVDQVDGQVQVWLCPALAEFITINKLEVAPGVLPAIVREAERIERGAPWALVLEKASTCSDPAEYPPQLITVLQALQLKGIEWRD